MTKLEAVKLEAAKKILKNGHCDGWAVQRVEMEVER